MTIKSPVVSNVPVIAVLAFISNGEVGVISFTPIYPSLPCINIYPSPPLILTSISEEAPKVSIFCVDSMQSTNSTPPATRVILSVWKSKYVSPSPEWPIYLLVYKFATVKSPEKDDEPAPVCVKVSSTVTAPLK